MYKNNELKEKALKIYKDDYFTVEFYMRNAFMEIFGDRLEADKISMPNKNIVIFDCGKFEIWGMKLEFYFHMNDSSSDFIKVGSIEELGRLIYHYIDKVK